MVVVRKIVLILACLCGFTVGAAQAQSEARIRVVLPSISAIEEDLKWLIELSPDPNLKKQWKKLKEEVIEAFTQGVDLSQPMELDLVFRKDEMSYEYQIPVPAMNMKPFQQSVEGMGFKFKNLSPNFYSFAEKGKKPYFLRFDKDYAWIAGTQAALPANPAAAAQGMAALLALKKDVIAELKNDAAGLEMRRANFRELRKQFEALIKFHRNEDKNAFELRKLALTQQLDEAERFVVESENLQVNWTTSSGSPNPTGRGEIALSALPGTDLLKSIEQFAVKPSSFANVALHPSPLAVGRITFPLDDLRIRHLKEFLKAVQPTLEKDIDAGSQTADEKTATKLATNKFLAMVDAGATMGVLDGFIDAHAISPGKNVMVAAIRAADGKAADEIIALLPKIKAEWSVEANKAEHGGVSIHTVTIPKARLESFQRIFAGETQALVGTSKDAIWCAAGVDALGQLKVAIDQAAMPAPEKASPVVISYQMQLAKLITLLDIVQKEAPGLNSPKTKEQIQAQKDLDRHRKLAQDTMGNCESVLKGELKRTDNMIEGFLELNECVLKYLGASIADTVKTTLQ